MEANLEMENLGKRSGITDISITNRIQEIEESWVQMIPQKKLAQLSKKIQHVKTLNPKHQGNSGLDEKPNLRIIGIEKNKDSQLKGPENAYNKIIEEKIPNLKKEMVIKV